MHLPRFLSILFLGTIALVAVSASEISKKVETGTHRPLFWYLNVHASEVDWIKVGGKKYDHVKGYKPNYLEVESLKAVFFVTDTGTSSSDEFVHFVSVDGKMECEIKFSDYIYIGSTSTPVSIVSSEMAHCNSEK